MNDNKKTKTKTKTKTTKAFIVAATILAVVASVAMIGIQTQMSQYALVSDRIIASHSRIEGIRVMQLVL